MISWPSLKNPSNSFVVSKFSYSTKFYLGQLFFVETHNEKTCSASSVWYSRRNSQWFLKSFFMAPLFVFQFFNFGYQAGIILDKMIIRYLFLDHFLDYSIISFLPCPVQKIFQNEKIFILEVGAWIFQCIFDDHRKRLR